MTRNAAIEYDLKKSPYKVKQGNNTFVFSSQLHADKFTDRLREKKEFINASLSNRFNIVIEFDVLAEIMLYMDIEKRGFLIITGEGAATCRNSIVLNGEKLTLKRSEKP